MCRIAGIFSQSITGENRDQLRRMLSVMARGGPDDEGTWSDEKVLLGHRRLSIIDLSKAGHQPMVLDNRIIITYNGEVYNFREIRQELAAAGVKFTTATDTEVIMAAYLNWGTGSFRKFRGMFAFALYDKAINKLFLVRDPSGIKPLYFAPSGGTVIFASEVKAFRTAAPDMETDPNWQPLFLAFGFLPHPFTTLKDVAPVTPGAYVEVNADGTWQEKFYEQLLFPEQAEPGDKDTVAIVRTKVEAALRRHLISDATLGVFLSGGIDSSLLTLLASREQADSLRTVSVNFNEATFDESPFQQQVLAVTRHGNHGSYRVDSGMFWRQFDDIWDAMDQPSVDGVNTFFVSQCAHESGLKAVLSGLGADELFGGYASIRRARWLEQLHLVPVKKRIARSLGAFRDAYRRLSFLDIEGPAGDYLFLRGIHTPEAIAKALDMDEKQVWEILRSVMLRVPEGLDPKRYVSYLETCFYMSGQLLKDTDYMSMRFGLEVRVPFLDTDLIRAIQSIPSSQLYRSGQPKYLLTKAFEDVLPAEIIKRKKQGFTFPFQVWLKEELMKNPQLINDRYRGPLQANGFLAGRSHWSKPWSAVVLQKFRV